MVMTRKRYFITARDREPAPNLEPVTFSSGDVVMTQCLNRNACGRNKPHKSDNRERRRVALRGAWAWAHADPETLAAVMALGMPADEIESYKSWGMSPEEVLKNRY